MKENCAPKKKEDMLSYTCYTKSALINIKHVWNKRHPDNKIETSDPYTIWKKLKNYFQIPVTKNHVG